MLPAMQSPFRHAVPIQVRFRDTDAMGHVNNAVFASYLEVARTDYWCELFGVASYNDVDFILARLEIDFLAPIRIEDRLEVRIRVDVIGRRSFGMAYEIARLAGEGPGEVVGRARSIQVMYDYARGTSKPLTDHQRQRLIANEEPGSITIRD